MRNFTTTFLAFIAIAFSISFSANSQSVLNPTDSVITYDSTHPPVQPPWGQIGKWVRTVRMTWNTDAYKCYIYKGVCFRLKFPKTYQPGVNDGKKYPMLVFFHGLGEKDTITDNEFHLLWGAKFFSDAVDNGTFDGYVLFLQSQGFWGDAHYDNIKELIDYMVVNNKLDPFQVVDNGLSSGGQGTWECYFKYPTYINAVMPMSSVAWYYSLPETVQKVKFTPIWNVHGGLDGSPAPYTAFVVNDSMQAAGANYRNTMYPNAAHDSWEDMWREPDFWPFINRVYASNPWALYGRKDYCSLSAVADTLGIVAGFDEYQWRKDGTLIYDGPNNKISVTQAGTYDARVRRGTLWSNWSKIPVQIRVVNCPGAPAKIQAENYNDMLGIQTETTTDTLGGLDVGWQDTGDWMDYLVSLQSSGNYVLNFRVATQYGGAEFQVRRPDGTVLKTLTVPNTGGWQKWQTIVTQVSLPAGDQRIRIFTSAAHGGWNINWWQMQLASPNNKPPAVNAGADQTVTLPTSSITLNGVASDDGTISTYAWTKVSGPAGSTFGTPSSASTTVSGLVQGSYVFRLTVSDNEGLATTDDVSVTVNIPSSSNTIHIEAESYKAMSGIQTETTTDTLGGLDVGWQDTGDWMDYSVNIPSAGTYLINFRVASFNTGAQFQLRKSDGTVLATMTVPNTGGWQNWQTTTASAILPAGIQTLRIFTNQASGGWNLNWFDILIGTTTTNQPPSVNAGIDQTIMLPASSATLNGTASDPDGTISTYAWTRVTGPSAVNFSSPGTASTNVSGLVQGVYVLRLTVTDNSGASASDDISITVNSATNQSPTVNAGIDQTITLPTSSVNLSGTASDSNGNITSYAWTRVSGPSVPNFSSPGTAATAVSGLVQGVYVFRLTVTDNGGASASDDVAITVNAATTSGSIHIEAENYTAMFGIQTEQTADVGGGLNVGWQDTGDWMDYSVNIPSAGTYPVNFRVASFYTGAQFQLRKSDGTVLATLIVPNTASWQSWQTITANVVLAAGAQTLRIYTNAANGGWNLNWFDILTGNPTNLPPTVNAGIDQTITLPMSSVTLSGTASDPDGTIATYAWTKVSGPAGSTFGTASSASTTVNGLVQGSYVFRLTVSDNKGATAFDDIAVQVNPAGSTIHIEAENYTAMFGIQTEQTADVGGGLNVGWQDTGDWMDYSVNIPSAGTYLVNFRVASFYTGAQFQLRKSDGTVLATLIVPNTASWQSWQTITANVVLAAGAQTLRIYTNAANGGWNLNWFDILTGSAITTAKRTPGNVQNINDGASAINVYPNPVTGNFRLAVNNNQIGELKVQIINANGVVVKTINLQKTSAGTINYSLSVPELDRGIYIIQASMYGWNANKQIIRQ